MPADDRRRMIDVPSTDNPETLRAFIKDARSIEPGDGNIADAIDLAERLLADVEREERDVRKIS